MESRTHQYNDKMGRIMETNAVHFGAFELEEGWLGYYQVHAGRGWRTHTVKKYETCLEDATERAVNEYEKKGKANEHLAYPFSRPRNLHQPA